MSPKVSIIITTRNRAEHLRETLASFRGLVAPSDLPTELLVVDNGSTDATAEVVKSTRLPQMPVRYFHEPKPGQTNARNSGLANTSGEVILFTDDDVRVPANWIQEMAAPILCGTVEAVAGGIKMAPHLQREWMTPQTPARPADNSDFDASSSPNLMGANMAFARKVLAAVPKFDDELGPGALGFGDETLFEMQLRAAGFRIGGAMHVIVEHHFTLDRLTRRNLLLMAASVGRSKAYSRYHWDHEEVHDSRIKALRVWFELMLYRILHAQEVCRSEGLTDTEFELVRRFHQHRHLARESQRPRNYLHHGLVKISA